MNNMVEPKIGRNWMRKVCLRKTLWKEPTCSGQMSHYICVLGVEDLPKIREGNCLVGNKFSLKVDPAAVICQVKHVRSLTDPNIEKKAQD